jgi:secondary thiamine-phosphate synthase enzyme
MVRSATIQVPTRRRSEWVDITADVGRVVQQSGVTDGVCVVSSPHTTAGITINENADPSVGRDFFWKLDRLVPRDEAYHHAEGNSDSHLKASLVGFSAQVPVSGGDLVLGTWQAVYFCEFDGPRRRRAQITVMGDPADG